MAGQDFRLPRPEGHGRPSALRESRWLASYGVKQPYLRIRRRCAPATSVRLRCATCNRINKGTAAVHRLDARINGAHRADFGQLELPLQLAACLILRVIGLAWQRKGTYPNVQFDFLGYC